MLELIRNDTKIDFVAIRWYAYAFSGAICALSLLALLIWGPRWGIDFVGGTLVHARFQQPVPIDKVREALSGVGGAEGSVQDFGAGKGEYLVRLPQSAEDLSGLGARIKAGLDQAFGASAYEILRTETVGPRVG